jgi:hypothetical protein
MVVSTAEEICQCIGHGTFAWREDQQWLLRLRGFGSCEEQAMERGNEGFMGHREGSRGLGTASVQTVERSSRPAILERRRQTMTKQPHESLGNSMSRLCGARKKDGELCRAVAIEGRARCHYHGGKTPRGIASPHFRTGRYSKYLPGGLEKLYENARADPDLLNLSDEIALYQGRILELVSNLLTGEAGGRWKEIQAEWTTLRAAVQRQDDVRISDAMNRLERLIAASNQDFLVWADIDRAVARYQSLVADERKRRIEMQALVSTDRAVGFAREVLLAVRDHVSDPEALVQNPGGH